MLRVLICGSINADWRREVEPYLIRDRAEYDQGLKEGTLTKESIRLPRVYPTFAEREKDVIRALNQINPQVIISLIQRPKPLLLMSHKDRLKWYHFEHFPRHEQLKITIYEVYLNHALFPNPKERGQPLVSVYTPTYNSSACLAKAYKSLSTQTYTNWEWVIIDDGSTDGTPKMVSAWAYHDIRIWFFRPMCGNLCNIGRMKHYATGLCEGKYLVELDHDDMLTSNALSDVVDAFEADADLGFVYSNFAEFLEDGRSNYYPDWMDRGRYRKTEYEGHVFLWALAYDVYGEVVGRGPVIKDMTVCPNHVRAFRRTELMKVGGYNPRLVMGDDYDLMIRMFCYSKIRHLSKLLYLYRYENNTWAHYNEFARFIFPVIAQRWEKEIDRRIEELKHNGLWLTEPQGLPGQDPEF